jgi:hypothetical protein
MKNAPAHGSAGRKQCARGRRWAECPSSLERDS